MKRPNLQKTIGEWLDAHPRTKDFIEALWEVIIVYMVSNLPFIFMILDHIFTTPGAEFALAEAWTVVRANVRAGEVLVYLSAIFGPIVYFYLRHIRAAFHYPALGLFLITPFIFFFFTTPLFLADRATQSLNQPLINDTALYTYVAGLVFWYFAVVYQKRILRDPYKEQATGADKILKQLDEGEG